MLGPLYIASEAAKRMADNGRIINFSSTAAKYPGSGSGIYSAAKRAVECFTESWARELGARGITVNTIIPGATSPGMIDAAPQARERFASASPFKRIGTAEEIAAAVAFLASNEASWVTGGHILANGAATM
jgi:3-oxoacyl-[acyl-carrier protein] reductase